jgi:hypothetical protein
MSVKVLCNCQFFSIAHVLLVQRFVAYSARLTALPDEHEMWRQHLPTHVHTKPVSRHVEGVVSGLIDWRKKHYYPSDVGQRCYKAPGYLEKLRQAELEPNLGIPFISLR